ncbi:MAG: hypothetical protein P8L77_02990 [Gammaproteobacteria bacterium]|nr:hypothetical protein [Gammaproteobacteria bacterium]
MSQKLIESVLKTPFDSDLTYELKIETIISALRNIIESDKNKFHLLHIQIGLSQLASDHKKDLFEHPLFKINNNSSDTTLIQADVVPEKFKAFMQEESNICLTQNLIDCYKQKKSFYNSVELSKKVYSILFSTVLRRTLCLVGLYLMLFTAVPLMPLAQTIGTIPMLSSIYDHQLLASKLSKDRRFSPNEVIAMTILITAFGIIMTTLCITFAKHPLITFPLYILATAFFNFHINNDKFTTIYNEKIGRLRRNLFIQKEITSKALNRFLKKYELSSESLSDNKKSSENIQSANELSLFNESSLINKTTFDNQQDQIMESILSSEYIK